MLADLDLLLVLVKTLLVQLSSLCVIFVLLRSLEGETSCREPVRRPMSWYGAPSSYPSKRRRPGKGARKSSCCIHGALWPVQRAICLNPRNPYIDV